MKNVIIKVDEVKTEVKFFNNYILDPERPQIPEEKVLPMVRIFVFGTYIPDLKKKMLT